MRNLILPVLVSVVIAESACAPPADKSQATEAEMFRLN